MDLENLKQFSAWYVALIAAGAIIAAPAGAAGNSDAFLVGIGLVLFGVGEFVNHPFFTALDPHMRFKLTGRPWKPSAFGLLLDAAGIAIFLTGLYRLIF